MRVLMVAWGSRGDVVPFVSLGRGLAAAGYDVTIGAARDLGGLVTEAGLEHRPFAISLGGEDAAPVVQRWLAGSTTRTGELRAMRAAFDHFAPILADGLAGMVTDADAIVSGVISTPGLAGWARRTGRPLVSATLLPQLPTRSGAASLYPVRSGDSLLNLLAGRFQLPAGHSLFGAAARAVQQRLGETPDGMLGYLRALRDTPTVIGVSPLLLPPPPDWPPHVAVTGGWPLSSPGDYRPPSGLSDFLADGDPLVYLGFGSMPSLAPEALRGLVLDAVGRAGVRAVLGGVLHRGGERVARLSDRAVSIPPTPFDWLFPRTAGVVVHGGVGTTEAALRAGVPLAMVPHISDQFYWGRRTQELGLGPAPLPRSRLTAEGLATLLTDLADPGYRKRADDVRTRLRAESGVETAVSVIRSVFG